ncbi:MAG: hypothetical protein JO322_12420 [Candidatus Eremiobacteraeota bacterium]|nr:hypothetical protein [Candidatus Eremiobacteraeota bacterium]
MAMLRGVAFAGALFTLVVCTTLPSLAVTQHTSGLTGAFYAAGGGAGSFSTIRALNSMFGAPTVQGEMQRLQDQFGDTSTFISMFDFAMDDAWQKAGRADVAVSKSSDLTGPQLGEAVVSAGTQHRVFTVQRLFASLFPPQVAADVLLDLDVKYGADASKNFKSMANSFFTDTGETLGVAALKGAHKAQ